MKKLILLLVLLFCLDCKAQSNECDVNGNYICIGCSYEEDCGGNCIMDGNDISCALPNDADFWSCCSNCTLPTSNYCKITIGSASDESGLSSGWIWFLVILGCIILLCCFCILCIAIILALILKGALSIRYGEIGGK